MRYFCIYEETKNPQPQFLDWYTMMKPGRTDSQIYDELEERNHFQVVFNEKAPFMDLICHPCFMVSKEFANLIRLHVPEMSFKYAALFHVRTKKTAFFHIPILEEIACVDKRSDWNHTILKADLIGGVPIFRLGGVKERRIMASLDFVEGAYRREVMGMKIQEYLVE